jgi:hypothetical protein
MRTKNITRLVACLSLLGLGMGIVFAVNGQEAFCIHPSHGRGGWSSMCYTANNQASQSSGAAALHAKFLGHGGYVTTRPCSR